MDMTDAETKIVLTQMVPGLVTLRKIFGLVPYDIEDVADYILKSARETTLIKDSRGKYVFVVRIADYYVGKLLTWIKEGSEVQIGEKYGYITWGSQVDIFFETSPGIDVRVTEGDIVYGGETILYREAVYYLEEDRDLDTAKKLLEESIKIDPYSEARYLLGEYYFLKEDYGSSLKELTAYAQLYPANSEAYLKMAEIYEKSGDERKAISVLKRGLNENLENVERYKPYFDSSVEGEYNQKAQEVYETYKYQAKILKKEIMFLEKKAVH